MRIACRMSMRTPSLMILMIFVVCGFLLWQTHLFHQIEASIQAETSMEQISSLGDAAKRLLTVTCDACASLSAELNILKPSGSLLHLHLGWKLYIYYLILYFVILYFILHYITLCISWLSTQGLVMMSKAGAS